MENKQNPMRKSGNQLLNLNPPMGKNKYYEIKNDPDTITNNSKNIFKRRVYKIKSPNAPVNGLIRGNASPW